MFSDAGSTPAASTIFFVIKSISYRFKAPEITVCGTSVGFRPRLAFSPLICHQ